MRRRLERAVLEAIANTHGHTYTLPRKWHPLVHGHVDERLEFNRRQIEVVAILELAAAIKAGEIFVSGSLSFDRFWDRLPAEAVDPADVAAYVTARGWADGADGLVRAVKKALDQKARFLDTAVGSGQQAYLQRGCVQWLREFIMPGWETVAEVENFSCVPL